MDIETARPAPVEQPRAGQLHSWRTQVAELFPAQPVAGRDPAWLLLLIAVAGVLLSLGRTTGFGALNTLWLEDGTVFLHDAIDKGPLESIVTPYSGYYHLLPRLLADIVAALPADAAAVATAILAATAVSLLATFVFVASGCVFATRTPRLLVAAVMFLAPAGYTETPNSINELRWYLMYAVFWAALAAPATARQRAVFTLVVGLAAFSDNVVAIFLPFFVIRLLVRPSAYAKWGTLLLGFGLVVNLATNILGISEHERIAPRVDPVWAVQAFVLRPVPQGLLGEKLVGLQPEHTLAGLLPVTIAWAVVLVCLVSALLRITRPNWPYAIVAGLYCAALYIAVIVIAGVTAPRYSTPSAMLAVTAIVFLVAGAPRRDRAPDVTDATDVTDANSPAHLSPDRRPRLPERLPALLLLAGLVIVMVINYRGPDLRGQGPSWSSQLAAARTQCAQGETQTARLQVSPAQIKWYAVLPCSYVGR